MPNDVITYLDFPHSHPPFCFGRHCPGSGRPGGTGSCLERDTILTVRFYVEKKMLKEINRETEAEKEKK